MVLFGHYINWKYEHSTVVKVASMFVNANDAVSFFFVLSGMVLTYPYLQLERRMDIRKFYVARVFRLYPGFLVALLMNVLYANRHAIGWPFIADTFIFNRQEFWEEAFLLRWHNKFYLPGWTLTIEILFSFFIPFIIAAARQNRRLMIWLILASLLMANITGFLFHFSLGALLSAYLPELRGDGFRQSSWYRYRFFWIPLALVLFTIRKWTVLSPLGGTLMYLLDYTKIDFFFLTGFASFIFLACILRFRSVQRLLEHRVLVFYGRISYGIYLMHWTLVWAAGDYWETRILPLFPNQVSAFFAAMAGCFIAATILATLLHYFIELPFIRLGKKITARMKPSVTI